MLTGKADLEDYLESFSSPEPAFLTEIRRRTHLETVMPRMLAGQVQGRFSRHAFRYDSSGKSS
jgi:hypothetical protein